MEITGFWDTCVSLSSGEEEEGEDEGEDEGENGEDEM